MNDQTTTPQPKIVPCPACNNDNYKKRHCTVCKYTGSVPNPLSPTLNRYKLFFLQGVQTIEADTWELALGKASALASITNDTLLTIARLNLESKPVVLIKEEE